MARYAQAVEHLLTETYSRNAWMMTTMMCAMMHGLEKRR